MVTDFKLTISGEKEKESSSDWSSSDEDEDGDDANFNPLRPSTHSILQAQWEWRAMGETLSEKWVNICLLLICYFYSWLGILCLQWQQATPPERSHHLYVAPMPRVSLSHHSTHTAELDYQILEDPSSFLEVYTTSIV